MDLNAKKSKAKLLEAMMVKHLLKQAGVYNSARDAANTIIKVTAREKPRSASKAADAVVSAADKIKVKPAKSVPNSAKEVVDSPKPSKFGDAAKVMGGALFGGAAVKLMSSKGNKDMDKKASNLAKEVLDNLSPETKQLLKKSSFREKALAPYRYVRNAVQDGRRKYINFRKDLMGGRMAKLEDSVERLSTPARRARLERMRDARGKALLAYDKTADNVKKVAPYAVGVPLLGGASYYAYKKHNERKKMDKKAFFKELIAKQNLRNFLKDPK